MYALILTAETFHLIDFTPVGGLSVGRNYITILSLFVANAILGAAWPAFFFEKRQYIVSVIISMLMLGSAITILVFYGIEKAWISLGCYAAYPLWLIFANVLGIRWAWVHTSWEVDPLIHRK